MQKKKKKCTKNFCSGTLKPFVLSFEWNSKIVNIKISSSWYWKLIQLLDNNFLDIYVPTVLAEIALCTIMYEFRVIFLNCRLTRKAPLVNIT